MKSLANTTPALPAIALLLSLLFSSAALAQSPLLAKRPAGRSLHEIARAEIEAPVGLEVQNGERRLRERQFDKALFHFKRALKENPRDPHALLGQADVYRMSHDFPRALIYYREFSKQKPRLAVGHAYTAMTLMADGKLDKVKSEIERYEKAAGQTALAFYLRGVLAQRCDAEGEAERAYLEALELEPSFVDANSDLGLLRAEQGKLDEAVRLYQRVLVLDPDNSEAYRRMGDLYHQQRNYKASIAAHRKAVSLNPFNAGAYANLGGNFLLERRYKEALESSRRALDLNPDLVEPYYTLGVSHSKLDQPQAALEAYKRFLGLAEGKDRYRELAARARAQISSMEPPSQNPRYRSASARSELSGSSEAGELVKEPAKLAAGSEEKLYEDILQAAVVRGLNEGKIAVLLEQIRKSMLRVSKKDRSEALEEMLEAMEE